MITILYNDSVNGDQHPNIVAYIMWKLLPFALASHFLQTAKAEYNNFKKSGFESIFIKTSNFEISSVLPIMNFSGKIKIFKAIFLKIHTS